MKVYTKTGDQGCTSLLTGERVKKSSQRVEAYGTVDEINSALGLARASVENTKVAEAIFALQKMLTMLMAELASKDGEKYITPQHIEGLEQLIDKFDAELAPLTEFITPGDNFSSAALDLARTVTRRAERAVLRLLELEAIDDETSLENNYVLIALNRLSDLCFILARYENEK